MSEFQFSALWPEDFRGVVKLFPLPNLVLFPHVVQPLHIFEPRYCELLEDALASDKLIAMATLKPDWEGNYDLRPPVHTSVCIGKVLSHAATDDNRHNILLVGAKRARIIDELNDDQRIYRTAEVELLQDIYPEDESMHRPEVMQKLQDLFLKFVPEGLAAQESFRQLVGKQLPLGILTDTIAYAMNLPLIIKLQLLSEENVDIRCRILTRCLEQKLGGQHCYGTDQAVQDQPLDEDKFPPPFSNN
jgi:ATP-dependent Lon protease